MRAIAILRNVCLCAGLVAGLGANSTTEAAQEISLNRVMSSTDDNRNANWNWTDPNPQTIYIDSNAGVVKKQVLLPFFWNVGPTSHFSRPGNEDYLPEQGWVLVYRDFGTEQIGVRAPLFLLYNRYKGLLRLFFYNHITLTEKTFAVTYLIQDQPGAEAALFTFDEENRTLDTFDRAKRLVSIGDLGSGQWSYADFSIVGFDNRLQTGATLKFKMVGVNKTEISIDGDISLEQILNDNGIVAGQSKGDAVDIIGGVAGAASTGWDAYQQGKTWYKNVASARKELKEDLGRQSKAWYWEKLRQLIDLPVAKNFVPGLAGVAGFIRSFIGGGDQGMAPVLPMKFGGKIHLKGEMKETTFIYSFEMRLPGSPGQVEGDRGRPLYNEPLGVFNLVRIPSVLYDFHYVCDSDRVGDCRYINTELQLSEPLNLVLNPSLAKALVQGGRTVPAADVTVEAAYVMPPVIEREAYYSPESVFTTWVEYMHAPKDWEYAMEWDAFGRPEIALKITITPRPVSQVSKLSNPLGFRLSGFGRPASIGAVPAPKAMEPIVIVKVYSPSFGQR